MQYPYRYKESQNPDGSIEHVPDPGKVMQEGTPQSATNFNKMENGILEALLIGSEITRMLLHLGRTSDSQEKDIASAEQRMMAAVDSVALDTMDAALAATENIRNLVLMKNTVDGLVGEKIQITLTNSQQYPHNNSKKTVQLTTPKNNMDYTIEYEVASVTGGAVGDFEFSDKLLNGFKIAFTGSAKSVTVNCYVRGGI